MTVFVTFTMGSKEAYFFNSPTHWAWKNLPSDVENLFTKQPPIKDVLELALGENGTYFVSFRDSDGMMYCRHYNLPNPLTEYLYHSHPQVIRDLSTLSLTLGPYESFYAHDKTSAAWSNLPPLLEKAVLSRLESQDAWKTVWKEKGREAPSFVSLGADSSYFMRTVGGGGSWDLKGKEDGMTGTNKFLEESKDFSSVAGLYLFPHHPTSYVLLLTSGKAFSNLPAHTWDDYNKMSARLPNLVQTLQPIPATPAAQLPRQPQPQQALPPFSQPQPQLQQYQFPPGYYTPIMPVPQQIRYPQVPVYASPLPPPYNAHIQRAQPVPQQVIYQANRPTWVAPAAFAGTAAGAMLAGATAGAVYGAAAVVGAGGDTVIVDNSGGAFCDTGAVDSGCDFGF